MIKRLSKPPLMTAIIADGVVRSASPCSAAVGNTAITVRATDLGVSRSRCVYIWNTDDAQKPVRPAAARKMTARRTRDSSCASLHWWLFAPFFARLLPSPSARRRRVRTCPDRHCMLTHTLVHHRLLVTSSRSFFRSLTPIISDFRLDSFSRFFPSHLIGPNPRETNCSL